MHMVVFINYKTFYTVKLRYILKILRNIRFLSVVNLQQIEL